MSLQLLLLLLLLLLVWLLLPHLYAHVIVPVVDFVVAVVDGVHVVLVSIAQDTDLVDGGGRRGHVGRQLLLRVGRRDAAATCNGIK